MIKDRHSNIGSGAIFIPNPVAKIDFFSLSKMSILCYRICDTVNIIYLFVPLVMDNLDVNGDESRLVLIDLDVNGGKGLVGRDDEDAVRGQVGDHVLGPGTRRQAVLTDKLPGIEIDIF